MGEIILYEGNNATQNIVATYNDVDGYDGKVKPNDEARSLKLSNVKVGCEIKVYDNGNGSTNDDYCIIHVKKKVQEKIIGTFEQSFEDDVVQVNFHKNNGLDGKVSYIRIN